MRGGLGEHELGRQPARHGFGDADDVVTAGARVARGADPAKDQSYVVHMLDQREIARTMFPIGAMTKSQVRARATQIGLRTAAKPDSQDVCFIEASRGREEFLRQRITFTPATIVDASSGEVLGSTKAAELMTVGQRRGVLPGPDGERRFVAKVDLGARRVEVGRLEQVMVRSLAIEESSMSFSHDVLDDGTEVWAQWSAHGRAARATLRRGAGWSLELDEPARPVAAGQTVVLYRLDEPNVVQGAGIVASS